ncbi:type II toxin-antitoxin system HicB family antitoxin [Treponema sp. OMZ 788]|uniref:type II toxin-antitoxin system HicB family antitoxin n=1 Tax=unclassified Treponema TaxID=2638727 RepID=UPI0020A44834|nr:MULTISPECIES: type II toxin-antitoxin system HicB family antitoxin [unclassified Treponema]UTC61655.1 type II toxin-antitoxin system HicB family antitoxin [Treponema sp. OMZ 787]UTC65383.1 type II toxin-antitoxin system HicB family antitoxin [Treponema sp. OMZ 788]
MKNKTYLAVFEPAGDGAYSVYFPHVLGCVSYGKNFIDAQKMAKEALELHIYGMEKDGDKLPVEDFSDIQTNDGDIVCAITIYPDLVKNEIDSRRVRTNCTIPYGLKLKAEQQGINFSQVLETSLKELVL